MLDPIVDLAPGAEENALATFFADVLRHNLRMNPRAQKSFGAMRATVHFVAVDSTEAVSMRFDHGRVTLHEGNIGIPAVTFCGERDAIVNLTTVPLSSWLGLPVPNPKKPRDFAALRKLVGGLRERKLIVYGFFSHARLATRVLRILSSRE
ncbi:MAG: hypothetical protein IPK82_04265 [Polyangiaceae bacterium]|nr:hypothetical protein [Polyangiaceae bacterium]